MNQSQPLSDSELSGSANLLATRAGIRLWQGDDPVSVLRVRGDDRLTWLNGQLTNDVRKLQPHGSVHALAVNVKGKIMAELWVTGVGEELRLVVAQSAQATLLESFERFIIMEDVTVEAAPEFSVCSLEGPEAAAIAQTIEPGGAHAFECDVLGIGGWAWMGSSDQIAAVTRQLEARTQHIPQAAYELTRLRHARPRYGVDYDARHYPQEVGLKALVSFQKGCYLGQEVVCTLESRGRLSKHLCALKGPPGGDRGDRGDRGAFAPATDLYASAASSGKSGESSGYITSSSWDPDAGTMIALGYVRRVHANPGSAFSAGERTLTLVGLVGEEDLGSSAPASA